MVQQLYVKRTRIHILLANLHVLIKGQLTNMLDEVRLR